MIWVRICCAIRCAETVRVFRGVNCTGRRELFAEPLPPGFGFSDTAFRIFILMASRRLKSDRFFTTDFTPRVYTQTGMNWIADNTFSTVLLRHAPALNSALARVDNAFAPWPTAGRIS